MDGRACWNSLRQMQLDVAPSFSLCGFEQEYYTYGCTFPFHSSLMLDDNSLVTTRNDFRLQGDQDSSFSIDDPNASLDSPGLGFACSTNLSLWTFVSSFLDTPRLSPLDRYRLNMNKQSELRPKAGLKAWHSYQLSIDVNYQSLSQQQFPGRTTESRHSIIRWMASKAAFDLLTFGFSLHLYGIEKACRVRAGWIW
jgi:hypothetical protein